MTSSVISSQSDSSMLQQRWKIHEPDLTLVTAISEHTGLTPLLAKVLVNQGIQSVTEAEIFLNPELAELPTPQSEFTDLAPSLELLRQAIENQDAIAICGDYDADGMTSTALLLRALKGLGAVIDYAIPSRMNEGYGINTRIVEDFAESGVKIILTVDNGIAAYEPVARARELGLAVIITDHHDLPPELPPANAILNPKLLAEGSPYRSLAGVGVAYVLAACLAQQLGQVKQVTPLLELFTLGTIADLAPLIGVNRRWVKRGLRRLPKSQYAGIQALIQLSGSDNGKDSLKPDAIGFRLGPRINAVGRIADPQTVIELLTTDDWDIALERAADCERINKERQTLCAQIEKEAIALICKSADQAGLNPQRDRILVLVNDGWHHGVIGIVASRLVERYGVPVFIATYENDDHTDIRGSARGNPEFNVFDALQYCRESLEKFGGHPAAGGFTLSALNWPEMRNKLIEFAHQTLDPDHLQPLISIDAEATLAEVNWDLFQGIDQLHPCGMGNREPVFWSRAVQVIEQKVIGKQRNHLKLILNQPDSKGVDCVFKAMAWRWGEYAPIPDLIDVAYRLRDNYWNGETSLELELLGYRSASATQTLETLPSIPPFPPVTQPIVQERTTEYSAPITDNAPLPKIDIEWLCPEPPLPDTPTTQRDWLSFDQPLSKLLDQISGTVLLYGYQCPEVDAEAYDIDLEYDRPTRPSDTLILWTIPPSWSHLKWLLALGRSQTIHVRHDHPPMLDADELRSHLKSYIETHPDESLNLLALGQDWWVAPSTIVSALREMDYPCQGFPTTVGLAQEFQRLQDWYQYPPHVLGNLG